MTSTTVVTRTRRTAAEKASEAARVASADVKRLSAKIERLTAEAEELKPALEAAKRTLDYRLSNPDLPAGDRERPGAIKPAEDVETTVVVDPNLSKGSAIR